MFTNVHMTWPHPQWPSKARPFRGGEDDGGCNAASHMQRAGGGGGVGGVGVGTICS